MRRDKPSLRASMRATAPVSAVRKRNNRSSVQAPSSNWPRVLENSVVPAVTGGLVFLEKAPADDHLLDLRGALADEQHRHLPVAAMDAEGVLHDLLAVFRREVLGHPGFQVVPLASNSS
jgi:hypothetical protein